MRIRRNKNRSSETPAAPSSGRWLAAQKLRRSGAILGVAGLLLLSFAGGTAAQAHDRLQDSSPKSGEVVDGSKSVLSEITLTFSDKPVPGERNRINVIGANGHYYQAGCVVTENNKLTTQVLMGAPGEYKVEWHAVSADGHVINGDYKFKYENPPVSAPGYGEPPACNPEQQNNLVTNLANAARQENENSASQVAASGSAPASGQTTPAASADSGSSVWIVVVIIVVVGGGAVLLTFMLRKKPGAGEGAEENPSGPDPENPEDDLAETAGEADGGAYSTHTLGASAEKLKDSVEDAVEAGKGKAEKIVDDLKRDVGDK